ncbi:MAG: signal peptidase I [Acidobacteriia bacterium]|nr:signal peptidase I [Terriglobia bacterium]
MEDSIQEAAETPAAPGEVVAVPPSATWKRVLWENVKSLLFVLIAVFFIRSFVIEATVVPTGSMERTILIGDHLFLSKLLYGPRIPFTDLRFPALKSIHRGDIVAFRFPLDPSLTYVKRVIAVPGETVQIRRKQVFVDGVRLDEPYVVHSDSQTYGDHDFIPADLRLRDNMASITIPPGYFFALGDNRDLSYDSRFWGLVPLDNIVGEPLFVFWSYDAPTQAWLSPGVEGKLKFYSSVLLHFFDRTRWNRTGKLF